MSSKSKKKINPSKALMSLQSGVPQRKVVHIGRNQPCPCGSGKKYKECHESEGEAYLVKLAEQRERERQLEELKRAGVPWYKRIFSMLRRP